MTAPDDMLKLAFGDPVENIAASEDNPTKRGLFIRHIDARTAEYATPLGSHISPTENLRATAQRPGVGEPSAHAYEPSQHVGGRCAVCGGSPSAFVHTAPVPLSRCEVRSEEATCACLRPGGDPLGNCEICANRDNNSPIMVGGVRYPGKLKLVYIKRWRTLIPVPETYADEIVAALATRPADTSEREVADSVAQAMFEADDQGSWLYAPTDVREWWIKMAQTALAALPSASRESGSAAEGSWKPIETAPKNGTEVLVWCDEGLDIARYSEREEDGVDSMGHDAGWWGIRQPIDPGRSMGQPAYTREAENQPWAWMPQPEPPYDDEGEPLFPRTSSVASAQSVPPVACPGGIDPGFDECPKCGATITEACAFSSTHRASPQE